MNFDLENVQPFLNKLSSVFDVGFSNDDIKTIQAEIEKMNEDNEEKEIGTFDVIYKREKTKIHIQAEIHIEDEDKEVVLYMYSDPELVKVIDEEMKVCEGNGNVIKKRVNSLFLLIHALE